MVNKRRRPITQDEVAERLVDSGLSPAAVKQRRRMSRPRRVALAEPVTRRCRPERWGIGRGQPEAMRRWNRIWSARRQYGRLPGWQVMLLRIQPGRWYAAADVQALCPEYHPGSVRMWLDGVPRASTGRCVGMFEKAVNPDHDLSRPYRRQLEPKWLYRLTGKGVEAREGILGGRGAAEGERPLAVP